jgi:hypothetical protein
VAEKYRQKAAKKLHACGVTEQQTDLARRRRKCFFPARALVRAELSYESRVAALSHQRGSCS